MSRSRCAPLLVLAICLLASQVSADCLTACCSTLYERPPMTYTFYQNTGHFLGGQSDWAVDTYAYSGAGDGYLNPQMQCVMDVGPL